jgi:hypothetical protein
MCACARTHAHTCTHTHTHTTQRTHLGLQAECHSVAVYEASQVQCALPQNGEEDVSAEDIGVGSLRGKHGQRLGH